jgi:hypothetical protein
LPIFNRLQQLRLELNEEDKLFPHVAECNQLRVLQVLFRTSESVSAETLRTIVVANSLTLEELRLSCSTTAPCTLASSLEAGAEGAEKWSVLAQCKRLRVMELPLDRALMLSPHLFEALGKLPAFQSLELALSASSLQCKPQPSLLLAALSSSSWCSVRLFLPSTTNAAAVRSAGGLTTLLPPPGPDQLLQLPERLTAALRRLRVFIKRASHPTERCFVLHRTSDSSQLKWHLEY